MMNITAFDVHLMHEGNHYRLYEKLGATLTDNGCRFCVFAPSALSISIFGSFNNYQKGQYFLSKDSNGIFSITIENIFEYDDYQYEIQGADLLYRIKADPFSYAYKDNGQKSVITTLQPNNKNTKKYHPSQPLNIYEIHLGGFKHHWHQHPIYTYEEHFSSIDYIEKMQFNAVEFMPLNEHPSSLSWGYQPTGFFAPTSRYGSPHQLQALLDYANTKLYTFLDVVLGHFAIDAFGLENFDGTPLFEDKHNEQWGVYNFNFNNGFVRSFLKSIVHFWLRYYQFDGIRLDAVNFILHYDGNQNIPNPDAECFLKELNAMVKAEFPHKIMIAEDSSTYPGVTSIEGLGFDLKWNLGWMHDTLHYFALHPLARRQHFHNLTFSFNYMYDENFLLSISHDEVVHLKKALFEKMYGLTDTEKMLNLRSFYAHMLTHPGKKLLFMGSELALKKEFDEKAQLDWSILCDPLHYDFQSFVQNINQIYLTHSALSQEDFEHSGFTFVMENVDDNVLVYMRESESEKILIILNTSGMDYSGYHIATQTNNNYHLILNSSHLQHIASYYENKNKGIIIDLPKFTTLYLKEA